MNRLDVIQQIINHKQANTYLEIGVKKGKAFLEIRARKKIAIDPLFKISRKRKIKFFLKNFSNISNEYYEMTSDMFFDKHAVRLNNLKGIDVAFIDGLHTYKQSLKDVHNCLKFLNQSGVIVMHDCNPQSETESQCLDIMEKKESMDLPGSGIAWSGDVWKTIANLRSTRSDLNIFVLDCDHGVGIITKGEPEKMLGFSVKMIEKLTYKDLEQNRLKILNLKRPSYLKEFLK